MGLSLTLSAFEQVPNSILWLTWALTGRAVYSRTGPMAEVPLSVAFPNERTYSCGAWGGLRPISTMERVHVHGTYW